MGYTKIVRFGDQIELYEYEKTVSSVRRNKPKSALQRKRQRDRNASKTYTRSDYSIQRAKRNFFRLCHHNNTLATTITFVTLTYFYSPIYSDCLRDIAHFFARLKKQYASVGYPPISYIAVPELTKKERYHFHLLVYNLPPSVAEREISIGDSNFGATRNIQRLWRKGYVTTDIASYNSTGIAGYMAKYMGKALADAKHGVRRGYNCSRNIEKISSAGSNSVDFAFYMIPDGLAKKVSDYQVPFLGTCTLTKYQL